MKKNIAYSTGKPLVLAFAAFFVSACGGGSGSSNGGGPDVVIAPPNQAPVVTVSTNQRVDEQTQVTLSAQASDSDGQIASIAWQQNAGLIVTLDNANSETITFVAPTVIEPHTLTFRVTVQDDDGAQAQDSVDVTVMPVNALPTVSTGENVLAAELSSVVLSAEVNDLDGEIASISWQQSSGIAVELTDTNSQELTFVAPMVTELQTLTFTVTVQDNEGAVAEDSINVVVLPVNEPPVVDAGDDIFVSKLASVVLNAQSSDSDGQITSVLWQQSAGIDVSLDVVNQSQLSFIAPDTDEQQVLSFTVYVTDNEGAVAEDTVNVIVNSDNEPPIVRFVEDITVRPDSQIVLRVNYEDSDGQVETFEWTQLSGEPVATSDVSYSYLSFTTPTVDADQTKELRFRVSVTDNQSAVASDEITVTIAQEQMALHQGASFKAGEEVIWESIYSNIQYGLSTNSNIHMGFERQGNQMILSVPYFSSSDASSINVTMRSEVDGQVYVEDTVTLLPDDDLQFSRQAVNALNVNGYERVFSRADYQDLNRDGISDIVSFGNSMASVFMGAENDAFESGVDIINETLQIKELLLVDNSLSDQKVMIWVSDSGEMVFYAPALTPALEYIVTNQLAGVEGSSDWYLEVVDIDTDGNDDIIASYLLNNQLVLRQYRFVDGEYVIETVDTDVYGDKPGAVAVTDVDNNGYLDIVVWAKNTDMITYLSDQDGYQKQMTLTHPDSTDSVFKSLPLDINRDGLMDFAVIIESGSIYLYRAAALINQGDGLFIWAEQLETLDRVSSRNIAVADIDGDSFDDIVFVGIVTLDWRYPNILPYEMRSPHLAWINNNGQSSMGGTHYINYPIFEERGLNTTIHLHVSDFDDDGKQDILLWDRFEWTSMYRFTRD